MSDVVDMRQEEGDEGQRRFGREGEKTIIAGMLEQMVEDGRISTSGTGPTISQDVDYVQEESEEFWDNISGERLDPMSVKEARKEDMEEFRKHNVYTKVPIQECFDKTGAQPVGTRWVDTNKGDKVHPEYRSRLVA